MTKRLGSKLLSVILTIAICATTVLGCLITANAAVACYSWSEGTVDKETLQTATIELTLTAPAELSGGITEAVFNFNSDEWAISAINVENGDCVSGTFDAANYSATFDGDKVDFATTPVDKNVDSDTLSVSNVTLALTLTFISGTATQGEKYNITISELNMGNSYEAYNYTAAAVSGVVNAGCDHVYSVVGLEAIETNTVDGYYVYENVPCSKCGDDVIPYQVVPATELKNVLYWDGTATEPTTTDSKGNILITSAAELAYITQNGAVGNYKVADGIDAIVLQPEAYAESIMALADYAQTKAYFESITPTVWKNGGAFKGTFDGNSVEIYGIYTNKNGQGALFAFANEGTTFKNFSIKNSYIGAGDFAGTVVGKIYSTKELTEVSAENVITFDKLVISGNYLEIDHKNYSRMGILFGGEQTWTTSDGTQHNTKYITFTITNSLVHSNLGVATMYPGVCAGLFGARHTGWSSFGTAAPNKYDNLVILDCTPYGYTSEDPATTPAGTKATNQATYAAFYSNVYTNCVTEFSPCTNDPNWSSYDGKIIVIDKSDAMGTDAKTNLSGLAWDSVWFADENGGYPTFDSDVEAIGGSILYGRGEPDTATGAQYSQGNYMTDLVAIKAGTATEDVIAKYGQGTEANPFLIYNSNHLRTVVQCFDSSLVGSYFKVADGIDAFVLQSASYINTLGGLDKLKQMSADEFKAYIETIDSDDNANNNTSAWQNGVHTGNWANAVKFSGHIDFNGLTIYGMYNAGGGLIKQIHGDTTFKNLTIANSYVKGSDYSGTILSYFPQDKTTVEGAGTVIFENCSIINCYIECTGTNATNSSHGAGALAGYVANGFADTNDIDGDEDTSEWFNGNTIVTNCIVYGTKVISASGAVSGLVCASGSNKIRFSNNLVLGLKPYTTWTAWNGNYQHCINQSYFTNVYTDQAITDGSMNGTAQTYTSEQIAQISASDVKGTAALTTLGSVLDFDNVWSYDGNGGYPTPVPQSAIYTTSQLNLNLLGVNNDYNDDGTFNFNFYYEPASADIAPVLYVGRADGNGFNKLTGVALEDAEASALGVAAGTLRYTIKNISAREIGDTFLGTAVAKNGTSTIWGKTEAISVADYATAILNDSSVSAADKKVAAALINYGTTSAEAFGITTPTGVATDIVFYNGGWGVAPELLDSSKPNSESNPYIIASAENLLYIVHKSSTTVGVATEKQYYKVADNIKAIVLQSEANVIEAAGSVENFMNLDAEGVMELFDDPDKTVTYTSAGGWNGQSVSQTVNGVTWKNFDSSITNNLPFMGHFDGNGATIYGYYSKNATSLFGYAKGATIKNLNVRSSYSIGYQASILIAGASGGPANYTNTIENCTVTDCAVLTNRQPASVAYQKGGILAGDASGASLKVNNCFVSDCIAYNYGVDRTDGANVYADAAFKDTYYYSENGWKANGNTFSIVGNLYRNSSDYLYSSSISNTIALGVYPYMSPKESAIGANYGGNVVPALFTNCYTDMPTENVAFGDNSTVKTYTAEQIAQIDPDDVIGNSVTTACASLDWGNEWLVGGIGKYPTPVQKEVTLGNGKTIYWSGDSGSEGSMTAVNDTKADGTSWDAPIIIDNAEELYYVIRKAGIDNTIGKYFKVADGIDRIVLQPEGVLDVNTLLACKDGAETKAYFETLDSSKLKPWSSTGIFDGNFNGNGVEILGLYDTTSNLAGFIGGWEGGKQGELKQTDTDVASYDASTYVCIVDGCNEHRYDSSNKKLYHVAVNTDNVGNTVSNITVGYSYMVSNNRLGVFGAQSQSDTWGGYVNGTLNLDSCAVINCYLKQTAKVYTSGHSGVATGECGGDVVKMNNMLVYGNNATDTNGAALWLKGGVRNDQKLTTDETKFNYNMVTNSIILGADPFFGGTTKQYRKSEALCFTNFYTDYAIPTYDTFTSSNAVQVNASDLIGSGAKSIVETLGDGWYIGNEFDGLPGFEPAGTMPTTLQIAYDSIVLDTFNDYGESTQDFGLYTTSLNFKNNPYMSLSFAFGNLDGVNTKYDRQNITVTVNGTELPKLPAYEDGVYISDADGWTNKKGAGRYHMYKLDDLNVYDLSKPITVKIEYNGKTITSTVSVEGFALELQKAYMVAPCDYYATRLEAVKALLFYTQALSEKYGA